MTRCPVHDNYEPKIPSKASKDEPSLAGKITSSAIGLAKQSLSLDSSTLPSSIASTSASGSSAKARFQTFGSGPSAWSQILPVRPGSSSSSSHHLQPDGFRSSLSGPSRPESDIRGFSRGKRAKLHHVQDRDDYLLSAIWQYHNVTNEGGGGREVFEFRDVGRAQLQDGAAVQALLEDPSSMDMAYTDDIFSEPTAVDLFERRVTAEERREINHFRSQLPPPPIHHAVSADNPLNFFPSASSSLTSNPPLTESMDIDGHHVDSILTLTVTQRDAWLRDWHGVLNTYTDEVWGDMLPTVEAARREIRDARLNPGSLDGKTVARLRMILGHVAEHADVTLQSQNAKHGLPRALFDLGSDATGTHFEEKNGLADGRPGELGQYDRSVLHRPNRHLQDKPLGLYTEDTQSIMQEPFHCPWISCHEVCATVLISGETCPSSNTVSH